MLWPRFRCRRRNGPLCPFPTVAGWQTLQRKSGLWARLVIRWCRWTHDGAGSGLALQTLLIEQANLATLQRARRPAVGALSDRLQDINGVLCHNATDRLRYLLNKSWREKRL